MAPIKQENGTSSIRFLEEETKSLKDDVSKFLSIITVQTQQLARQDRLLNELRDERNAKAGNRLTMCWVILLVVAILMVCAVMMGPTISNDTALYLNVKATPVKAPFITAGVKVRFTMGDLAACVKGAFSGDTIDLSLS